MKNILQSCRQTLLNPSKTSLIRTILILVHLRTIWLSLTLLICMLLILVN